MSTLAINGGRPVRMTPFKPYPYKSNNDLKRLEQVWESHHWGGLPLNGGFAERFIADFKERCGVKFGVAVANGTVALSIALQAAGIKAGDEVITSGLTWAGTAYSIVTVNAVPVFADIDPATYCLSADAVAAAVTPKTKAIIVVHLANQLADMDDIMEIARHNGLIVIEDCAHAHFAQWRGKPAGTIGDIGTFSFETSKIISSGEGGALICADRDTFERAISYMNCGRKEAPYDSYLGRVLGGNFRLSEWQAAILCGQMETYDELEKIRYANCGYFFNNLSKVGLLTPMQPDERVNKRQYYELLMKYDSLKAHDVHRDIFLKAVLAEGIELEGLFYHPLNCDPLFQVRAENWPMIRDRYGDTINEKNVNLPNSRKAAYTEGVWLHHQMMSGTKEDVDDVLNAIAKVSDNVDELVGFSI